MLIALDISFAHLGWSAINKGEVIDFGTLHTVKSKKKTTKVSDDKADRAAQLAEGLKEIILKHNPLGIVAELPSGSQNANAANLLGWANGVVVSMATAYAIPCEWISEGDSKKAAIGKRTGTKGEMMEWATKTHPKTVFPKAKTHFEHVADSLAAYNGLKHGILVRAFG